MASGAEDLTGGSCDLAGRNPGCVHELRWCPGAGKVSDCQVGYSGWVTGVAQGLEDSASYPARRLVVLVYHQAVPGGGRCGQERVGVDGFQRVQIDNASGDPVDRQLVGRG